MNIQIAINQITRPTCQHSPGRRNAADRNQVDDADATRARTDLALAPQPRPAGATKRSLVIQLAAVVREIQVAPHGPLQSADRPPPARARDSWSVFDKVRLGSA